jgi:hypothetical protein
MLYAGYFADESTYISNDFWRQFRMNKEMFLKLMYEVLE